MSNEIVDDLKLSNLEISEELGIRLTSANANIKHSTKGGTLNIKSDGAIYIQAGTESDSEDDDNSEAGDINIDAGNGYGLRDGGDININAGDGNGTGEGGDINLRAGESNENGDGGNIYMEAGQSNNNDDSGYVEIYGADNYGNGNAGYIYIQAGYANNGQGGDLTLYGGSASGVTGGGAGNVIIESGTFYDGITGSFVEIRGGYANTTGGDVNIYAGNGSSNNNGNINLTAKNIHLNGTVGGNIYVEAGDGVTGGVDGGNVYIESGASYDGMTGSFVEIKGGYANTTGGDVNIYAGNGLIDNNGNINLTSKNIHLNGGLGGSVESGITSGAISLETLVTKLTIIFDTANTISLADGFEGQTKVITCNIDNGGTGNIVLGNGDLNRLGYTTIQFNDVGNTVTLVYVSGGWVIAGSYGVVIG